MIGHSGLPANTGRWHNVGVMLGQRRRRWPHIEPTFCQRVVFAAGLQSQVKGHTKQNYYGMHLALFVNDVDTKL